MAKEENVLDFHDVRRQIDYLRQVLSHDKKPIALFLGAGCPTAIPHPDKKDKGLIPDIDGLTELVVSRVRKKNHKDSFNKLYSHFEEDEKGKPNIEDILSHIRSLKQVCGSTEVRGLTGPQLDQLEKALCDEICKVVMEELPSNDSPYHHVAAWMVKQREKPIEIFTTNYDLLMEQALEETRVPYFDGFVGARMPFFDPHAIEVDPLPSRWARIWKLHGSINWFIDKSGTVVRGEIGSDRESRVIHPSHLKYDESRRMPYLALIDRLKFFLKQPSAGLVICGYSFGDEHLNEVIIQGLQGNSTASAFALLFAPIEKYPEAIKLAATRSNLSLLAKDEAIIGTKRGKWLKQETGRNSDLIAVDYKEEVEEVVELMFKLGDFDSFGRFVLDLIGKEIEEEGTD